MKEFQSISIYTLEEYLSRFHTFNLGKSWRRTMWYKLIKDNNLTCPATGKTVAYCSYDYNKSGKSFHYNFYSEDGELFTLDHKTPKSLGGHKTDYDNIQPMIYKDNFNKGSELIYT